MARTEFTDIYCNSCIYASKNNINSCQQYKEKSQTILNGGVCSEYIRNKDKYLSDELAYQLDQAILHASDISMEHAIVMGNIVDISNILGHAQTSTTMNIYAHSFEKQKRVSSDKIDEFLKMIA